MQASPCRFPAQHLGERGPDHGRATRAHAGHFFQTAIVGGEFQGLKRVHAQNRMYAFGKIRPDTWNGLE